jgi:hypothetical protein
MSSDSESSSSVSEMGLDFVRSDGLWKVLIDENVYGFQNLPSEVSNISVDTSVNLNDYSGKALYFVNPGQGASGILNNVRNILRYQEACEASSDKDIECEGNLPVKDCSENLFVFRESNETEVYQDDNCIYIVGDSVKGTDAFLYKVLGVY